jgi:hypothetical protein
VNDSNPLSSAILEKVGEQAERADHLIGLLPPGRLDWRPAAEATSAGDLLGHLLECMAGFCAALYALRRDRLAHFERLSRLRVNHSCAPEEARSRMRDYMAHIEEGFSLLCDDDLARLVPTVFAPEGEAAITILLGNLEHLINHKYQLFFYLKLLGVPVSTGDLYRLRGA